MYLLCNLFPLCISAEKTNSEGKNTYASIMEMHSGERLQSRYTFYTHAIGGIFVLSATVLYAVLLSVCYHLVATLLSPRCRALVTPLPRSHHPVAALCPMRAFCPSALVLHRFLYQLVFWLLLNRARRIK